MKISGVRPSRRTTSTCMPGIGLRLAPSFSISVTACVHVAVRDPVGVEHRRLVGDADVLDEVRDDSSSHFAATKRSILRGRRIGGPCGESWGESRDSSAGRAAGFRHSLHAGSRKRRRESPGNPDRASGTADGDCVRTAASRAGREHAIRHPTSGRHPCSSILHTTAVLLQSLILAVAARRAARCAADKVDINTADAATIDRVLLNIGPSKAEAIVAYRKANGALQEPEQLAMVKGIGLKTIEKNRDRIVLGAAAPARKARRSPPRRAAAAPKR